MVVGQAPGPTAAERPLPYSGASGRTLRTWLSSAGFGDVVLYDPERFYLTSVTKCFPGRSQSGNGDRAPSRHEIEHCSGHLAAELELVQPELILALGRLSIGTFLPSLKKRKLADVIGHAYDIEAAYDGAALVLPLPHPSGVSRWHNAPENRDRLSEALFWLREARARRGW